MTVESVRLYRARPPWLYGLIAPFLALSLACGALAWRWSGDGEAALLAFAAVACVHALVCLSSYWSVDALCLFFCVRERDAARATLAKVVPLQHQGFAELVPLARDAAASPPRIWFTFQKLKYVYDAGEKRFEPVAFPVDGPARRYLESDGIEDEDEEKRATDNYGTNALETDAPEFLELFKERATAPFFVFQVFCVALWCMDKYWYYSLFTLAMLVAFECTLVQQQLRNMAEIRKMGNRTHSVYVHRRRRWIQIKSDRLLPGDILSLIRSKDDLLVPCDVALLRGSCIVDESMLTGESVPQMKEPLDAEIERDRDFHFDADTSGKLHVLYGGTKIVQHSPPPKGASNGPRSPENGCVGYVLRTGFNTSQGKLLRTILYGVKRVTANNLETFGFILFLLVFAVAAAAYVWVKGCEDPERNRYKLFLECALILTSVVPPELPIELSLAVNTSLLSLSKLSVFCTEPFRIPFAGRVDVCCFDKTGTLTSDDPVVEGVAGVGTNPDLVVRPQDAPPETIRALASCHSLAQLDDGIVGDPLEKATLRAVEWNLTRGEAVVPQRGKAPGLKIFRRFHFSSALKRMAVVAGYQTSDGGALETFYVATVKGAPEALKPMFVDAPEEYDRVYLSLTRRGARVLALGHRDLGKLSHQEVRDLKREAVEARLKFAGFVIISCPLKSESKRAVCELLNSSHSAVMITGDNPLTACHVAKELNFTSKGVTLILTETNEKYRWKSIDESLILPIESEKGAKAYFSEYDLCITGDGLEYMKEHYFELMMKLLPHIKIFARFDPKQKEYVILKLKQLGYCTLMCGDGTNDVGALKHAEVGVAILSNAPEKLPDRKAVRERAAALKEAIKDQREKRRLPDMNDQYVERKPHNNSNHHHRANRSNREPVGRVRPPPNDASEAMQAQIQQLLKEMDANDPQVVKLGDASIAAPFTSRLSSIMCICHIIKQGRCTLVTTLQMFKILALNALILAYSQSVLYLDGIKFSDTQATLQGLLLASCFLFISRSKPLEKLSKQRPLPNIFNVYTIMTVLLQFAVHFCCLIYLVREATQRMPPREGKLKLALDLADDEEDVFVPDLLNSTVYIISMALQVSTFAINYRGEPFMESLTANRPLLYSVLLSGGAVFALALGIVPELSDKFEIVSFPQEFKMILVQVLIADMVFAFLMDRACLWLFGEGRQRVT